MPDVIVDRDSGNHAKVSDNELHVKLFAVDEDGNQVQVLCTNDGKLSLSA